MGGQCMVRLTNRSCLFSFFFFYLPHPAPPGDVLRFRPRPPALRRLGRPGAPVEQRPLPPAVRLPRLPAPGEAPPPAQEVLRSAGGPGRGRPRMQPLPQGLRPRNPGQKRRPYPPQVWSGVVLYTANVRKCGLLLKYGKVSCFFFFVNFFLQDKPRRSERPCLRAHLLGGG